MSVAAIVLAAGRGTRFGDEPKLLASFGGKPIVRRAAEAAVESGLAPVLVVTGHREAEVRGALADLAVNFVSNPGFADGLASSLRAGFEALSPEVRAAAILLGDMPLVSSRLLRSLARDWREAGEPPALVPTLGGRRGNPVVLSARLKPLISALTGDQGAGPLLAGLAGVVEREVDDAAVIADVDTPAGLRALAEAGEPSPI